MSVEVNGSQNSQVVANSFFDGVIPIINQQARALAEEDERTNRAFKSMMGTLRDNYNALADGNIQLQSRVAALEAQLENSEKLLQEENKARLEAIEQIKVEKTQFQEYFTKRILDEGNDTCTMQKIFSELPEYIQECGFSSIVLAHNGPSQFCWRFSDDIKPFAPQFFKLEGLIEERKKRPVNSVLDAALQKKDTQILTNFDKCLTQISDGWRKCPGTARFSIFRNGLIVPLIKTRQARENA